jgi:integrase
MPRIVAPLTESQIRAMMPRATRYSVADGNGLVLEVMPTGTKVWRFRYTLDGKRQPLATIGDYRRISLRVARERARKYADMVARGVSPAAAARRDRGAEKRIDLLRDAAELYMSTAMAGKSDEYRRTARRALDKDVLPAIGGKPIGAVSANDVAALCEHIKARGSPAMALHTRHVIRRLYAFLIAQQRVSDNPAAAVPAREIATPAARTRVLRAEEIGAVLRGIHASSLRRPLKIALHLLALTLVRKSWLIEAKWDEFDLDAARWTVPATRASRGTTHDIVLSRQAVALLRELREHGARAGRQPVFAFPTVRGALERPIAKSTLNQALSALNLSVDDFVLDDWRRTAAAHLLEQGHPDDAIARALGRAPPSPARAEHRRKRPVLDTGEGSVMQAWADFVDGQWLADIPGHPKAAVC